MSPISSDRNFSEDSDGDDNVLSHGSDAEVDSSADTSTNPPSTSVHTPTATLYKLCGDNIDKTVRQRYMRTDTHGTIVPCITSTPMP